LGGALRNCDVPLFVCLFVCLTPTTVLFYCLSPETRAAACALWVSRCLLP